MPPSDASDNALSNRMNVESPSRSHAEREKHQAALSSVVAAAFLTGLKVAIGLLTGSLGILAEAAHSGLDLVAALVTLFAVRISDRPPDERHLYGYGKVENLSALIETLLLLATCVWIIYEAIQRLFFEAVEIEASVWAFGVMATSIVVDVTRSRILYRVARKYHSQALEADALHFSTDIWSSSVVIGGLMLVWLSERLGPGWAWLVKGDAVAALAVAFIVVFVSLQLGKRAVSMLLDMAPPGLARRIGAEAAQVPGVHSVGSVRLRQAGPTVFVDLVVNIERCVSLEEAHQTAEAVEERLAELLPVGDAVVHVDPVRVADESLSETVSSIGARLGLRVHSVRSHEMDGFYSVDFHVEVPTDQSLSRAYDLVGEMEKAVIQELPDVADVHIHVEPAFVLTKAPAVEQQPDDQLAQQLAEAIHGIPMVSYCSEVHVRPGFDGYDVVLYCQADEELTVIEAHNLAHLVEKQIHHRVPTVREVLVHLKPTQQ